MYEYATNFYSFTKVLSVLQKKDLDTYRIVIAAQKISAAMPKDFPFAFSRGLGCASWVTDEGWMYRDLSETDTEVYVEERFLESFLKKLPYPFKLKETPWFREEYERLYELDITPQGFWDWLRGLFLGRDLVKIYVIPYYLEEGKAKVKTKNSSREIYPENPIPMVWRKIMGKPIKVMPEWFLKDKANFHSKYNWNFLVDACVWSGEPRLYESPPRSGRKSIIKYIEE